MSILSPISETFRGGHFFLRGVAWLKAHPRHLLLLFLPMLLAVFFVAFFWGYFWQHSDSVFTWVMFAKPESWWGGILYYICKGILYVITFVLGLVLFTLGVNVLSSPIYEHVSIAVERDLRGGMITEVGLWDSLKLIAEELKKVSFILLLSLGLMLIPGVNFLTPLVTAFCIGWDLYDFPLARRGWTFRQRAKWVRSRFWSILGLGAWLLIPGVQMLLMPLAVVGGTMLAIEDLGEVVSEESRHSLQIDGV